MFQTSVRNGTNLNRDNLNRIWAYQTVFQLNIAFLKRQFSEHLMN